MTGTTSTESGRARARLGLQLATLAAVAGVLLACSPDRTPKVPPGTPGCQETCETAWPCGGVLENDLSACISACDDEEHGTYRVCVAETACEEMYDCKRYAPGDPPVTPDTDTDTPSE
ncbi:MAG: hypothetical protein R3F61_35475 [Myxococcota bacterium]